MTNFLFSTAVRQRSLMNIKVKDIDFDTLVSNNNMYDIDHIYPQALIKDDSLNNRVLVEKTKNNEKKDNMLFEMPGFLHKDAYAFYDKLRSLNLISKEKYNRLTKKELTQGELDAFVNRQIVATNQAVKGLIEVLKNTLKSIEFKMEFEYKMIDSLNYDDRKAYLEKMCQEISKINDDIDRDYYMNAQEALEYGIIDQIL